jgi:uncharacterized membrane protein YsdA (DUF1294 family)/cold shock CspA family protein
MKQGLRKGQLKSWKDDRGFGFIQPADNSPEIFLHISEIKDSTRRPVVGDTIYYAIAQDQGKVRAIDAVIQGARLQPNSSSRSKNALSVAPIHSSILVNALLLAIFPLIGIVHFVVTTGNVLPLLLYGVMSLVSFFAYADDKSRAKKGTWRTPEKSLLLCDLAGGWMGGFIAQQQFHHKNSKASYQLMFRFVVAMHYLLWLGWLVEHKSFVG